MEDLNSVMKPGNQSHNIKMHIIKTKYGLYDICFEKIIEHFIEKDSQLYEILVNIRNNYLLNFKDIPSILNDMHPVVDDRMTTMKQDVINAAKETAEVLEAAEHLEHEISMLKEEKRVIFEQYEIEKNELRTTNELLSLEIKQLTDLCKRSGVNNK